MAEYRAFPVKNLRLMGPSHIIECDTDQDAIERATQFVDGHDIELWNGSRLVAHFKAKREK